MKILITGSAGFLGTHLTEELESHGYEIIGWDRSNGDRYELANPGAFRAGLREHRPDMVIHLAARVGRLHGEDDLIDTIHSNATVTALVAQACGDEDIRLVYASTSEIYGDCGNTMAFEAMTPRLPHNAYGLSKRHGEEYCHLYAPKGLIILRFSMPYGPGLPWGYSRAAIINFLYQAHDRLPIPVHTGSERSWCYVGDTVRGVRMILESGQIGAWNVGRDDNPLPLTTVARIACEMTGAPTDLIEEIPGPPRQTIVKRLATEKLRSLGWSPEVEIREGMEITYAWMLEQGLGAGVVAA